MKFEMQKALLLLPTLLAACTYLGFSKWSSLISRHGPNRYPYTAGVLHGVEIPKEVFIRPRHDSCCSPCETYDVLDKIRPGNSSYRIIYKNYLGVSSEGELNDIIEYALIWERGDSISMGKSIFIHDKNEITPDCYWLTSLSMDSQVVHFEGVSQKLHSIEKRIRFVFKDSLSLSNIRMERAKFKRMIQDAIK